MTCNTTDSTLTCCVDKNYVQDKVCTPWSGTVVAADVLIFLYVNNINQNIFGTGYVKFDVEPGDITLDFLDSTGTPINLTPITIESGTSLAFTYRRFSSVRLTLPAATAGTYQGEFCITTRYLVQ